MCSILGWWESGVAIAVWGITSTIMVQGNMFWEEEMVVETGYDFK